MKPEIWQDEKVGDLSHGARLLLVGLITMADDEGRLRALTSLIVGHIFPYDEVQPAKLKRWVGEITDAGLILPYKADGKPYIAFRNWRRHQKPNRANASVLPAPPDQEVVTNNSLKDQGKDSERAAPHAGARGSRSGPDPEELPEGFDSRLASAAKKSHAVLKRTAEARGAKAVTLSAVARAVESYPMKNHAAVAGDVEHWLIHGNGSKRPAKDIVSRFRNFLTDSPDAEVKASRSSEPSAYDAKTVEVAA